MGLKFHKKIKGKIFNWKLVDWFPIIENFLYEVSNGDFRNKMAEKEEDFDAYNDKNKDEKEEDYNDDLKEEEDLDREDDDEEENEGDEE